jgi:hypothetical protein
VPISRQVSYRDSFFAKHTSNIIIKLLSKLLLSSKCYAFSEDSLGNRCLSERVARNRVETFVEMCISIDVVLYANWFVHLDGSCAVHSWIDSREKV